MPPVPFYIHDLNAPEETSAHRYFAILPVTVVTKGRKGAQTFTNSLDLFRCLEHHAAHRNTLTRIAANGLSVDSEGLSVLNLYLHLHRSLAPFYRVSRYSPLRGTKYQWEELAHHLHLRFTP
jgi:hypothetical protein